MSNMAHVLRSNMYGCGRFVLYLVFSANFVIWLASVALIVLGIWVAVDRPYLEQLLGSKMYMTAAYLLLATGFFIFFLSFLGCYGAIKEVKCMILTYAIIVLILFITIVISVILGYVYMGKVEDFVRNGMKDTMKNYKEGSNELVTNAWDDTQIAIQCCAIDGQSEWKSYNVGFNTSASKMVPKSCCKRDEGEPEDCQGNPTKDNSYTEGCLAKAGRILWKNAFAIGGVGVTVAIVMVLGFVLAIFLYKSII